MIFSGEYIFKYINIRFYYTLNLNYLQMEVHLCKKQTEMCTDCKISSSDIVSKNGFFLLMKFQFIWFNTFLYFW